MNKYVFYISIIKHNLNHEFKQILNNLKIIFSNIYMLISFLVILPFVFYVIKIQIFFGLLFFIFYLFLFTLHYKLIKSDFTISCKEIPLNTSCIYMYSFFNVFVFLPKSKAFLFSYNLLNIIINGSSKKLEKIIILFVIFIISILIKIYILLLIGYTFLSILVSSNLIISYFETISWKYENLNAKMQHIIINCLMDNKDSIGKANDMNIIIKNNSVVFNMQKILNLFCLKTKNPEKFKKAFSMDDYEIFLKKFTNGHFSYLLLSKAFPDKNITKNYTSSKEIKVKNEKNVEEKIKCVDKSNPNIKGQNKDNFLTRTYELNKEKTVIKELDKNMLLKMQNLSKNIYASMVDDKDKTMLYSENGKFYSKENSPTVKEYSKEYKISIYEKIKCLEDFEKSNEAYLNTEEGMKEYELCKNIMKGMKYNNDSDIED